MPDVWPNSPRNSVTVRERTCQLSRVSTQRDDHSTFSTEVGERVKVGEVGEVGEASHGAPGFESADAAVSPIQTVGVVA
jgi:hypothetical protein